MQAPTGFKVMKTEGHGPLSLTVMPPYRKQRSGTFLDYPQAPMEQWTLLASEEAQLRMGIPKYLIDAEQAKNDAILARVWQRPGKD